MASDNKADIRATRWEASATVAVDTNWFTNNIVPSRPGRMAKFTLLVMVPTSTVIEVDITDGTTNKTGTLNDGTALTAAAWYAFSVFVPPGYSFNIQHKTTTQNVVCIVCESLDNSDF